ncbi:hypothetical protein J8C02_00905 [Chloracidobacterium sp. MS 40/45]|uniref:hypothetical protein n=1 Tax=Chloracidobacterium aggregatum TaxID=2851959 RepID=UPI001B8BC31A|nr:hypothetical protein [Chloracidobacterium aggregatum]QUW00113.1 hypothetical protein J8C02_00905 [Chloracidobacterium sp. MS 40/45]
MNPTDGFNRRYATGGLGAYVIRGLKPTAKFNRRYATSLGARASCLHDELGARASCPHESNGRIQPSLRDGGVGGVCDPWVETHG